MFALMMSETLEKKLTVDLLCKVGTPESSCQAAQLRGAGSKGSRQPPFPRDRLESRENLWLMNIWLSTSRTTNGHRCRSLGDQPGLDRGSGSQSRPRPSQCAGRRSQNASESRRKWVRNSRLHETRAWMPGGVAQESSGSSSEAEFARGRQFAGPEFRDPPGCANCHAHGLIQRCCEERMSIRLTPGIHFDRGSGRRHEGGTTECELPSRGPRRRPATSPKNAIRCSFVDHNRTSLHGEYSNVGED